MLKYSGVVWRTGLGKVRNTVATHDACIVGRLGSGMITRPRLLHFNGTHESWRKGTHRWDDYRDVGTYNKPTAVDHLAAISGTINRTLVNTL